MSGFETGGANNNYERNEQRKQDIKFIRVYIKQMDQGRVLRWREEGEEKFVSKEEVAKMRETDISHTGQMGVFTTLIIKKAKLENDATIKQLDKEKVYELIFAHDIEENFTADNRQKDEIHYQNEESARALIAQHTHDFNLGPVINSALSDYTDRVTKETHFVKAVDELQAWCYMIYTRGFGKSNRNFDEPDTIKGYVYAQEFPTLKRIADILLRIMQNPTSISSEINDMELIKMQYAK